MQRDPRWGRNQEVPGEDPELTGNYAAMFVQGLQGEVGGLDEKHTQITACCKHFIANSLEQWKNDTRYDFDAEVPNADLHNYYLPPFRSCVQEGRSKGVMCSYNAVTVPGVFNNVPSCSNDWLLQTTLRDSWRFDGYVTSDCGAVSDECKPEPAGHGLYNCTVATAKSIQAGTDVDCGPIYANGIGAAVAAGILTPAEVDVSFGRLTAIQMQLGLFDNNKADQPYFNLGLDDIDTPAHQQLALEAAQQALVLLKNDKGVLPLAPGAKIAIVGPHYNATQLLLSNYHGSRCAAGKNDFSCIVSPMLAIAAANGASGSVTGAAGCSVAGTSTSNIAAAVAVAAAADVVILAVGIDDSQEREGLDRVITTLPGVQTQLVAEVLKLKKPKTIVAMFNGGALSLGSIKDAAPAIVAANYGGEAGGLALADVLFGRYNPSGKLAATMYPSDYVNQIPLTEMGLTVGPGRTHMFYTGTPEFPFGAGLSYTDWAMSWADHDAAAAAPELRFALSSPGASPVTSLQIKLRNAGGRPGRQTVLLFWRPKGQRGTKLRQKLVGYRGTGAPLHPGQTATLTFEFGLDTLAMVPDGATDGAKVVAPGEYELFASDGTHDGQLAKVLTRSVRVTA